MTALDVSQYMLTESEVTQTDEDLLKASNSSLCWPSDKVN